MVPSGPTDGPAAAQRPGVEVELLWFSGCSNSGEIDGRLRQALPLADVAAEVVLVEVTTPEDAERLGSAGPRPSWSMAATRSRTNPRR